MNRGTAFVLTHESDPERQSKSTSIIALALTRALGRQGVPVVRIHPNLLDRSLDSRYCTAVEISPDFYESETALLDFLLALAERYPGRRVLIPGSDDCAWFIAQHHEALSRVFAVAAPPLAVMEKIIDKEAQYAHARRLGIPIPETWFPADLAEVVALAPTLQHYPYVIKPLVAHTWRRAAMKGVSQGKKGFAVHGPEELVRRYEAVARGDRRVMIQEVIGGADERLFTFLSYFDTESRPRAYCIRKKVRQFPVDFGYCTLTVSCHDDTVREQSIRLLADIGFHGLSGVEWKLDPENGLYKLIEINPRAVNTSAIAPACGVDLPIIAFLDKLGEAVQDVTEWQDGIKWINLEQDLWAARELHRRGSLGWTEWWRSVAGPRIDAIYAADDLQPFAGHLVAFLQARLARLPQLFRRPPVATTAPAGAPAQPTASQAASPALD